MSDSNSNRPQWLIDVLSSKSAFKIVGMTYFIVLLVATFFVLKLVEDDPQPAKDFGVFIAVLCALVAMILAQLTLNKLGGNQSVVEGDPRMKLYLYGGFGAALLLALALSMYNHMGTVRANESEITSRAEREAAGRAERGPGMDKAAEMVNQYRQKKEAAATKP